MIKSFCIGQVGYLFEVANIKICLDPYLSNSIEKKYSFTRLFKIKNLKKIIKNLDFVFITHEHEDHCDISTLLKIYKNSPNVVFVCPFVVSKILIKNKISKKKILVPAENKKNKIIIDYDLDL